MATTTQLLLQELKNVTAQNSIQVTLVKIQQLDTIGGRMSQKRRACLKILSEEFFLVSAMDEVTLVTRKLEIVWCEFVKFL